MAAKFNMQLMNRKVKYNLVRFGRLDAVIFDTLAQGRVSQLKDRHPPSREP